MLGWLKLYKERREQYGTKLNMQTQGTQGKEGIVTAAGGKLRQASTAHSRWRQTRYVPY